MATITPVDIGAAPDDGNGDPLRTAFSKLNGNDSNINTELAGKALASHTHSLADITDEGALAALDTVGTAEIDNDAVTLAKLADMATDSFLGRDTAGSGDPEVLSAASARTILNVEDGAVAPPFVTADYTDASVTLAKLADIATDSFIGRDTAGTGVPEALSAATARTILNVEDGATADQSAAEVPFTPTGDIAATDVQAAIAEVDSEKITTGSNIGVLGSGVFVDKSGTTLRFKNVNAGSSKVTITDDVANNEIDVDVVEANLTLGNMGGEVGTTQIATNAVTLPKLAQIATASFLGRSTGGTGNVEVLSASGVRMVLNVEDGAAAPPYDTADLSNNAVTLAKFQDIVTASFLGRVTAATGDPEVLTATQARSILNVEDGANAPPFVTADYTDDSVTYAKIQDVSAQWRVLGRISTGAGDVEEVDVSALTDQASPAGTDVLLAERASDGNLVKIQVGNLPTGGGGEANTASNLGAGVGVFEGKSGIDLQFNSLVSQNPALIIAEDDANDEIDFDLDINAATDLAAPATGDELLIGDISDSNNVKKADVASVVNLADHDALTNFVADEHVDHTSVTLTAGDALSGGGDISANRTFDVDINGTTDLAAPATGDELLLGDISNANAIRKADVASVVNLADHDALTNFVADEHVAHGSVTLTAGDGLSGGGTIAANRTFDVDISGATDDAAPARADEILFDDGAIKKSDIGTVVDLAKPLESFVIVASDKTTAITTGTNKAIPFRMPYAFTVSEVRASMGTAPTGSVATFDINQEGTTILSTKLTVDATERTSTTAATAAVISDSTLDDDVEITIDFDGVGSTIAGDQVVIELIGRQT